MQKIAVKTKDLTKILQDVLFMLLQCELHVDKVLIKQNLRFYWKELKILTILTLSQNGWYSMFR